jgi:hypothetical protein
VESNLLPLPRIEPRPSSPSLYRVAIKIYLGEIWSKCVNWPVMSSDVGGVVQAAIDVRSPQMQGAE